ncbi:hypothetical protein FACHB389_26875 [Nostoc calcicola FACHB-389]|nr:hypothetical protein FACHB389_26875 [Nostoc calcicola FACHB-389]
MYKVGAHSYAPLKISVSHVIGNSYIDANFQMIPQLDNAEFYFHKKILRGGSLHSELQKILLPSNFSRHMKKV